MKNLRKFLSFFSVLLSLFVSSNLLGQTWKQVAASYYNAYAIRSDGTLWAWGRNHAGQLGIGNTIDQRRPVQVGTATDWDTIVGGAESAFALRGGTLWAVGMNSGYQLGLGTNTTNPTTFVQVGTDNDWKMISSHAAIKNDGTLWQWGIAGALVPTKVGTSTWKSVSGDVSILAIRSDGTLWSWGGGILGYIGNGSTNNVPTQIGSDNDWKSISANINSSSALKNNGTLWTWGLNDGGSLGQPNLVSGSSLIPAQAGSATDWKNVITGGRMMHGIKTDGSLWGWGWNYLAGSLGVGHNNSGTFSTPLQVGSSTDWKMVVDGYVFGIALKNDGTVWLWGSNEFGQLGRGNNVDSYSPIQLTFPSISIAITSGSQSVCSGGSVTFTATAANTSATAVYQWKKNGTVVGSNSATYTASNLANGDVITCALTSEAGSPASNSITMSVSSTTPSVPSISGASAVDIAASITLTNTTAGGTWTSSNPAVATVVNGVVTGVSPGDATITYTVTNACGSNAATKTIRVNDNSTYCLKYVPRRVGNTVEFTISMIGSGSTLRLGTANIQIKYNTSALSTPTLVSEVLTATGNYSGVTLTQPSPLNLGANEAIISLNTNFTGTTGQGLAISTDEGGTPIAVVSFQLQNASASPNLQSYLNNDIGSVIYNDNTSNPYLVQNTGGCANYTAPLTTSLSYDAASFCLSATPQNPTVTGATGGIYSSTAGLTIDGSTGVITPATSTPATYWVTYTVPNPQGGTTAFQVTIHPNPTVNITNLNASYCQNASAVALSGTPSGGAFTINGTNATSLNPSALALGSHSVVYTYTDANTCTGTATQNITINGLPIISAITGASSVYIGSTITLSNATVGGVWSSANSSFATISNEGVVTGVAEGNAVINYAVTNACGTTTVNHNLAVQLSKILLTAKAILQGNYNAATSLMSDNLRQNNLIPTTEPYTTTNNFTHRGGGGGEVTNSTVLQTTGNDAIVDWIFVELRDKNAPATVLYTRAALVQRDGDIVDVDGTSAVSFSNAMPDDYYVAIRHRNHLGFRTAATVAIGRTVGNTLDLTDGTVTLFGRNALKAMSNGKFAMYGGNGDSNGAINAIDKNTIWIIQNGLNTYLRGDFNLDGVVNAFDINSIWLPNNSVVQQLD